MIESVAIYGLVDQNGLIAYAGATLNPQRRFQNHVKKGWSFRLRILRWTTMENANRIEGQVKCQSQAWLNITIPRNSNRKPTHYSAMVLCIETGQIFPSFAAAMRQFGVSSSLRTLFNKGRNDSHGFHWKEIKPGDSLQLTTQQDN